MKLTRVLLAVAAVLLAVFLAYAFVGIVVNVLWYAVVVAFLGAGTYAAYRILARPAKQPAQLETARREPPELQMATRELDKADRLLAEYKEKMRQEN